MVSPSGLGVDLWVKFPTSDDSQQGRFVRLSAVINGQPVSHDFDITGLVGAGEESTLPLELDFAASGVPRFEENQEFTLTAEAYTSDGLYSTPAEAQVQIYLPIVIVHGYMGPGLLKEIFGRIASGAVYQDLSNYLRDHTQAPFVTGYTTDPSSYRTVWFEYYPSRSWTPDDVMIWLDGIVNQAQAATYADRVDLVCHSLGGLLGRYYACFIGQDRVHKLIMIGTPNAGSSMFYWETRKMSAKNVGKILAEQPLARWLAPMYNCLYDWDGIGYTLLTPDMLTLRPPSDWLCPEEFPDTALPPPNIAYYSIYNDGVQTPCLLQVEPKWRRDGTFNWYTVENLWYIPDAGDGIVPWGSAFLPSAQNINVTTPSAHLFLPADSAVKSWVLAALCDD
jgi:pimeloyl-ACP methyl ester carboxylesterase